MEVLFCSREFISKVRVSGKDSADVFLEATDEEVSRWLTEGRANRLQLPRVDGSSEQEGYYHYPQCGAEIIPPAEGIRSRAVVCPNCESAVTPRAKVILNGSFMAGFVFGGFIFFLMVVFSEKGSPWLVWLRGHEILSVALLVLGCLLFPLLGSFVFYMVAFRVLKPIGSRYRLPHA